MDQDMRDAIQEYMNKVDEKIAPVGELQQSVTDTADAVTTLSAEFGTMKDAFSAISDRKNRQDRLVRASHESNAIDGLTPGQLMFGAAMVGGTQNLMFANRLAEAQSKLADELTIEQVEDHLSDLQSALPTELGVTRKQWVSTQFSLLLADAKNALDTGATQGGTQALIAADMLPYIVEGSNVLQYIPVEPRLMESGNVKGSTPFTDSQLVKVQGTADLDDTNITSTPFDLIAGQFALATKVARDYEEDFNFGNVVDNVMAPSLRKMGYRIDGAIVWGDTRAASNQNGQNGAGAAVANLIQRSFDGWARRAGKNVVVGGPMSLAKLGEAYGKLGQQFAGTPSDIVAAIPMQAYAQLAVEGWTSPSQLVGTDGMFPTGVNVAVHDSDPLLRTADGTVSGTANQNVALAGVMFNRMACIGGFARGMNVEVNKAPAGLYNWLIPNFRWAFHVNTDYAGAGVTLLNITP